MNWGGQVQFYSWSFLLPPAQAITLNNYTPTAPHVAAIQHKMIMNAKQVFNYNYMTAPANF